VNYKRNCFGERTTTSGTVIDVEKRYKWTDSPIVSFKTNESDDDNDEEYIFESSYEIHSNSSATPSTEYHYIGYNTNMIVVYNPNNPSNRPEILQVNRNHMKEFYSGPTALVTSFVMIIIILYATITRSNPLSIFRIYNNIDNHHHPDVPSSSSSSSSATPYTKLYKSSTTTTAASTIVEIVKRRKRKKRQKKSIYSILFCCIKYVPHCSSLHTVYSLQYFVLFHFILFYSIQYYTLTSKCKL
jgi:hypothetical protein